MARRKKKSIGDLSDDEFKEFLRVHYERLRTEFPPGTVVELKERYVGIDKGTKGFIFIERFRKTDIWKIAFENGYVTDFSVACDESCKRTGEKIENVEEALTDLPKFGSGRRRMG